MVAAFYLSFIVNDFFCAVKRVKRIRINTAKHNLITLFYHEYLPEDDDMKIISSWNLLQDAVLGTCLQRNYIETSCARAYFVYIFFNLVRECLKSSGA